MSIIDSWYHAFVDDVDERTRSWFLVDSTRTVLALYIAYFSIIYYFGPLYMKNREPYSLKKFVQCFDIFQILINSYIVYLFIAGGWIKDIWIYCVPFEYSTEPGPMMIAEAIWVTTIVKFIDFIETIVYILRKKYNQVSGLHVYHHSTTALISWLGVRYIASGMASFIPIVNCSVHVVMYTYYYLASLGPKVQKIIRPYKPILTIIQMVQFVGLILYSSQPFLLGCPVSKRLSLFIMLHLLINFILFYDFYQKTYKPQKTKKK